MRFMDLDMGFIHSWLACICVCICVLCVPAVRTSERARALVCARLVKVNLLALPPPRPNDGGNFGGNMLNPRARARNIALIACARVCAQQKRLNLLHTAPLLGVRNSAKTVWTHADSIEFRCADQSLGQTATQPRLCF